MMASLRQNSAVTQYWRLINSGSYWLDYAHLYEDSAFGSLVIPKPDPDSPDGMRQFLPEGWITYMLWDFFDGLNIQDPTQPADKVAVGSDPIFDAIASDRYIFLQNYNTGRSEYGSDFVDFLDALICGLRASGDNKNADAIMDLTIERQFPYDRSPVCEKK